MDWIGTAFILCGVWLIGSKKRAAFPINLAGSLFWIVYGLQQSIFSIVVVNAFFILFNARGWALWARETPNFQTIEGSIEK